MAVLDKKYFTASIRTKDNVTPNFLVVRAYTRGLGVSVTVSADGLHTFNGNDYLNYKVEVSGTNGNLAVPFREVIVSNIDLSDHPDFSSATSGFVFVNGDLKLVQTSPPDNVYDNP